MKRIKVFSGWIKTQSVTKFSKNQEVLFYLQDEIKIGKIDVAEENEDSVTLIYDDFNTTIVKKEDLQRLVVSDGERFVPLQNEDWQKAINKGLINSDKKIKYIIIERYSRNGNNLIKLARIYKPSRKERERQIAKAAYIAGQKSNGEPFKNYWNSLKRKKSNRKKQNELESI